MNMQATTEIDRIANTQTHVDIPLLRSASDAGETREAVLGILLHMRRFYELRNLSHIERYGQPDTRSRHMLARIERAYENAGCVIDAAAADEIDLAIECNLTVGFRPSANN